MIRVNPLFVETLRGLATVGRVHLDYLNYLLLQALVVFFWWPKSTMIQLLENQDAPNTLLALIVALGVSLAYYNLRAGGEEILLPGQHPLREWALATPLSIGRILSGYLYGHAVQMLHALALSSPLLLMAWLVSANTAHELVWSLLGVVLLATFYRLLGALMYLMFGHYEMLMFISLRGVLVVSYLLGAMLLPLVSHLVMASRWLKGDAAMLHLQGFLAVYGALSLLLIGGLYWVLTRQRRGMDGVHSGTADESAPYV
jgi:hypothetical protein